MPGENKITDFKEYHKEYYRLHKSDMIQYGCQRVECDLCHRIITRNQLLKHQQTKLCKKNQTPRNEHDVDDI